MAKEPRKFNEWNKDDRQELLQRMDEIIADEKALTQKRKNLVRFINRTSLSY